MQANLSSVKSNGRGKKEGIKIKQVFFQLEALETRSNLIIICIIMPLTMQNVEGMDFFYLQTFVKTVYIFMIALADI
jgi:hypothetical protein